MTMCSDAVPRRVIISGTPGPAENPNHHNTWRETAEQRSVSRALAYYSGREVAPPAPLITETSPDAGVLVQARICWERKRHILDATNAASSLKGMIDGLTDARWWEDDTHVHVVVTEQITWGRLDAATRAFYPGGCVVMTASPVRFDSTMEDIHGKEEDRGREGR